MQAFVMSQNNIKNRRSYKRWMHLMDIVLNNKPIIHWLFIKMSVNVLDFPNNTPSFDGCELILRKQTFLSVQFNSAKLVTVNFQFQCVYVWIWDITFNSINQERLRIRKSSVWFKWNLVQCLFVLGMFVVVFFYLRCG